MIKKKVLTVAFLFSLFCVSVQAAGVHDSARRGRVCWDHAAGWLFRLTSVRGLGGHPPPDAAAVLCAHLHWHRNQVSRYGESEHGKVENIVMRRRIRSETALLISVCGSEIYVLLCDSNQQSMKKQLPREGMLPNILLWRTLTQT